MERASDDCLRAVLHYLRDATTLLNLAATNDRIRARMCQLVTVAHYSPTERRGYCLPNASEVIVYRDDQANWPLRKLTVLTEQSPDVVGNQIAIMKTTMHQGIPMQTIDHLEPHPLFTRSLPDTLTDLFIGRAVLLETLPSQLVKLRAPYCRLEAPLPKTLTNLWILTIPADKIRESALQNLKLQYGILLYVDMPSTLTTCVAKMERDIFTRDDYDVSRFVELRHTGAFFEGDRGAVVDPSKICASAQMIVKMIARFGIRPKIRVYDYNEHTQLPDLDVNWNIYVEGHYATLPKTTTKLACDSALLINIDALPPALTKLKLCDNMNNQRLQLLFEKFDWSCLVKLRLIGDYVSLLDASRLPALRHLSVYIECGYVSSDIIEQLDTLYAHFGVEEYFMECARCVLRCKGVITVCRDMEYEMTSINNEDELEKFNAEKKGSIIWFEEKGI